MGGEGWECGGRRGCAGTLGARGGGWRAGTERARRKGKGHVGGERMREKGGVALFNMFILETCLNYD